MVGIMESVLQPGTGLIIGLLDRIGKVFIKKDLIQELYKLEKERNADDSKDRADAVWGKPVLKEGAVLFLKEGKLLFYRIREEEKQQKITD